MAFQYTGEYVKQIKDSRAKIDSSIQSQQQQSQALVQKAQPKEGVISSILSKVGGVVDWGVKGMGAITGKEYQGYDDITASTMEKLGSVGKWAMEKHPVAMMSKLLFPEATQRGIDTATNKLTNLFQKSVVGVTKFSGEAFKFGASQLLNMGDVIEAKTAGALWGTKGYDKKYGAFDEKDYLAKLKESKSEYREPMIGFTETVGQIAPTIALASATGGVSALPAVRRVKAAITAFGIGAEAVSSRISPDSKLYQALNSVKFSEDPEERQMVGQLGGAVLPELFDMAWGGIKKISKVFLGGGEDIVTKTFNDYGSSKFGKNVDTFTETKAALNRVGIDEALAPRYMTTFNNQVLKSARELIEDTSGKIVQTGKKVLPLPTVARQTDAVINQFIRPFGTVEEAFDSMVKYVDDTTKNIDLLQKTGTRLAREDFLTSNDMQQYIDKLKVAKSNKEVTAIVNEINDLRGGSRVIDYYEGFGKVRSLAGETGSYKGMRDYLLDKLGIAAKKLPKQIDVGKQIEGYKFIKSPKGVPEFYASVADVSTNAQRTKIGKFLDTVFGGKENVILSAKANDRLRKLLDAGEDTLTDYEFGKVREGIRKLMEDADVYNVYGVEQRALDNLGVDLGKQFEKNLSGLSQTVYDSYVGELMDRGLGAITNKFLASNLPGAGFLRNVSAKTIPSLRYRYNPLFKAQEAIEPGIWAGSRGIAPFAKPPKGMMDRIRFTREGLAEISDVIDEQGRLMTRTASETGGKTFLQQLKEGIFGHEAGIRRVELASTMVKQSADYSLLKHADDLGIKRLAKESTTDFINRIYKTAKTVKNRNWDNFNKAIALAEADAWEDVANILYLPSSKSMIERTLNSSLLFWPISYVKRVTSEAAKLLYSSFGGVKTGVLGASLMHRLAEAEREKSKTNREYREWKEKHRATLALLRSFLPVDMTETFIYASPILQSTALLALSCFNAGLEENDMAQMIAFVGDLNIESMNAKPSEVIPTYQRAIEKQTAGVGVYGTMNKMFNVYKEQRDLWQRNQRLELLRESNIKEDIQPEIIKTPPELQKAQEFNLKYSY